ncbi:MAG: pyrroline-5-carboxylate reductase [Candidatus Tokpelaia sp. JSC161]|jgi:pyrroline-5-carboxylate reductase|nr:MAG: pyrroline-5-carboxylate reductase [Candidatus Tokpelaia sp. JSC161]
MKLGFLGTGMITDSVVRGLCTSDFLEDKIFVSPRNIDIADKLASDFSSVKIAGDNQELLDYSDIVFIALRESVVEGLLTSLSFRKEQKIVSFVPTLTCMKLSVWINHAAPVFRAAPLPFVAEHKSATPVFPVDSDLRMIFEKIGGILELGNEEQFNVFMTAGSLMGIYFYFSRILDSWMQRRGMESKESFLYLSRLFFCLAHKAFQTKQFDFRALQKHFSTKGGTNELIVRLFKEKGGDKLLSCALDEAFFHITGSF